MGSRPAPCGLDMSLTGWGVTSLMQRDLGPVQPGRALEEEQQVWQDTYSGWDQQLSRWTSSMYTLPGKSFQEGEQSANRKGTQEGRAKKKGCCSHYLNIARCAGAESRGQACSWLTFPLRGFWPWENSPVSFRIRRLCCCCSAAQLCLTLWPRGLWHARPPCPSLSPGVCSNSCPLSQWCHPTISSSVASPAYRGQWQPARD